MKKTLGLLSTCFIFTACHNSSFEAKTSDFSALSNPNPSINDLELKTINIHNLQGALSNLIFTKFTVPKSAVANTPFDISVTTKGSTANYTYALSLDPNAKDVTSWSNTIPKSFSISKTGKQQKLYFFAKKNGLKYSKYALITITAPASTTTTQTLTTTNMAPASSTQTSVVPALTVAASTTQTSVVPTKPASASATQASTVPASDTLSSVVPASSTQTSVVPASVGSVSSGSGKSRPSSVTPVTDVNSTTQPIVPQTAATNTTTVNSSPTNNGYGNDFDKLRVDQPVVDCETGFSKLGWTNSTPLSLSFSTDEMGYSVGPNNELQAFFVEFEGPVNSAIDSNYFSFASASTAGVTLTFINQKNPSQSVTTNASEFKPPPNEGVNQELQFFSGSKTSTAPVSRFLTQLNRDFYSLMPAWENVTVEVRCNGRLISSANQDLASIANRMNAKYIEVPQGTDMATQFVSGGPFYLLQGQVQGGSDHQIALDFKVFIDQNPDNTYKIGVGWGGNDRNKNSSHLVWIIDGKNIDTLNDKDNFTTGSLGLTKGTHTAQYSITYDGNNNPGKSEIINFNVN